MLSAKEEGEGRKEGAEGHSGPEECAVAGEYHEGKGKAWSSDW